MLWKTDRQLRQEIEQDLRRICAEEGVKRWWQIEAEERQAKRAEERKIQGLPEADEPSYDIPLGRPKSSPPKAEKPPKPEKPKKQAKPDNFVTISEWAKKWGIEPSEARAMMRGSGLEKPTFGWAFDPKDEKKIKKICGVK